MTRSLLSGSSSALPPPDLDILASKEVNFQEFDIIKVLGKGSFGKVLLVKKKDSQRLYAMKILKKELIHAKNQIDHTKTERSILQHICSPFIVSLKYAFQTADKLYFVTEFCSGGELFVHLRISKKFSELRTKFYAAELIAALETLHSNGIIYRDLKPENILLCEDGHVKLTDFGLSKEGIEMQDRTYTFCGTPEYLAPEILLGEGHSCTADWWSLGVLMYEMLDGNLPFFSDNRKEMFNNILHKPVHMRASLGPDARSLLKKLLERDPARRLGALHGARELKEHPFFSEIDWGRLGKKDIKAPYRPRLSGETDLRYFDRSFTSEEPKDTPVVSNLTTYQKAQNQYEGFTFKGTTSGTKFIDNGI
eukprot:CAMPEP_0114993102 /NCGR_PEP_ID=MMETSP0216-20121206/12333_1 /TAXON_ID=223996 /ORGANISM="Protocruzia adherens, Strain Boccale" /LENGTH=364 /DNA_ID=CAMNT_0002356687 /DNA_START=10 /DNA_END=1104 /DNA_ORIENTATION=-